jgi:putative membrane protein
MKIRPSHSPHSSRPIRIARLSIAVALIPAALFAQRGLLAQSASQTQPNLPQQQPAASTSMQDSSSGMGMTAQTMKDKIFLRKAAEGGMAEVQLGQLAAQKSDSPNVKAFGQKMVTEHTALNEQMKQVAESLGVRAPKHLSKDDQAEYDKLNGLAGSDFDTEYLTFMVKDHHQDLREFREAAQTAADPALKEAAARAEKVIQQHLMMVDKLAKEKGIQMAGHKPASGPAE